eukprot:TRINITY_DN20353_c0_g1_i1.p1 TRINITY_DN20353_c0_g1~~TRINITY_DN20353_c0_g1_i1.p1  ORF type:complete len:138 (+),score=20.66 TRINITY_DN20353_c0_g1_i1:64-477(+)
MSVFRVLVRSPSVYLFQLGIFFFFQAEDGIRDLVRSRGLGDVYKRQSRGSGWTLVTSLWTAQGGTMRLERRGRLYSSSGYLPSMKSSASRPTCSSSTPSSCSSSAMLMPTVSSLDSFSNPSSHTAGGQSVRYGTRGQ